MGFNNRSIVVCFAFSALHERYYIFARVLSDTSALPLKFASIWGCITATLISWNIGNDDDDDQVYLIALVLSLRLVYKRCVHIKTN